MTKWISIMVPVIAVALIIGLVGVSNMTEACAGGDPGADYVRSAMTAEPGDHMVKSFKVEEGKHVIVEKDGGGSVFVLTDAEMDIFRAGGNYSTFCDVDQNDMGNTWIDFDKGTYWVVLDNTEGNEAVTADVDVYVPAEKCDANIGPVPTPGFELGAGAASLMLMALILVMTKR